MPRYASRPLNPLHPDPVETTVVSRALPLFVDHIERHPEGQLLDVGPVCGENIRFFASRTGKLYVCDLFQRLCQERRKGRSASRIWPELNYPVGSFEAVQVWDLADHLGDRDFAKLVELCFRMVKREGMLMMVAMGEGSELPSSSLYGIEEGFRLRVKSQPDLDLPVHYRHNHDLIAMLTPFKLVKSFIYRSGLREFLFEHP